MISSTEFETNKWVKTGNHEWTRLGVTVKSTGIFYHIKFKYDNPSSCYFSLFKQLDETSMSSLMASIKEGVSYILKTQSYSKRVTQKYKRTLNNWLF